MAAQSIDVRLLPRAAFSDAGELLKQSLPELEPDEYWSQSSEVAGAFDEGRLIGVFHFSRRCVNLLGETTEVFQCGPAATAASHRGKGVFMALDAEMLKQAEVHKVKYGILETPIVPFHRKFGWEIATFAQKLQLINGPTQHFANRASIRPMENRDVAIAATLSRNLDRSRWISVDRDEMHWSKCLDSSWRVLELEGSAASLINVRPGRTDSMLFIDEVLQYDKSMDLLETADLVRQLLSAEAVSVYGPPDVSVFWESFEPSQLLISTEPDKMLRSLVPRLSPNDLQSRTLPKADVDMLSEEAKARRNTVRELVLTGNRVGAPGWLPGLW